MSDVIVYSTEPCPFCTRAKELLDRRGIAYEEINLAGDPEGREKLLALTGMMSFPQIVIGGEVVGGFDDLVSADQSGRLAELAAG